MNLSLGSILALVALVLALLALLDLVGSETALSLGLMLLALVHLLPALDARRGRAL